jgi:transaldolase
MQSSNQDRQDLMIEPRSELKVAIFADGADRAGMLEMSRLPYIKGFTTNPSLMRKAGVADYLAFAHDVLSHIDDRPISFEVFADEPQEMERQACRLASLGKNVSVKVPITTTAGKPLGDLIRKLSSEGISINVTAMMTLRQLEYVIDHYQSCGRTSYVSIFAGRIADTGRDPVPMMAEAVRMLESVRDLQLIWASCRELLNIFQADQIGCHVITVTNDILGKLPLVGKDLDAYSLETVKLFHTDGAAAAYTL